MDLKFGISCTSLVSYSVKTCNVGYLYTWKQMTLNELPTFPGDTKEKIWPTKHNSPNEKSG